MKQLLEDPETIPFKKGKNISMKLLKKQIDRRIDKIRNMLGYKPTPNQNSSLRFSKACQTGQLMMQSMRQVRQAMLKVQSPNKQSQIKTDKNGNDSGRCSLPITKNSNKKQSQGYYSKNRIKTKLSDYYSGIKRQGQASVYKKRQEDEDSDEFQNQKEQIQTSQDNKIFQSDDFDNFVHKHGEGHLIPLNFEDFDENGLSESDSSDNMLNNTQSLSNLGSKGLSLKKIRFTDRTAAQSEKRIVVSEQCVTRMLEMISKLSSKKRREGNCTKLRENIIKRIQEKYGDYDYY